MKTSRGKFLNLAHYFPYDVKLRPLAHSRSFLANLKTRNAIVGAENLLNLNNMRLFCLRVTCFALCDVRKRNLVCSIPQRSPCIRNSNQVDNDKLKRQGRNSLLRKGQRQQQCPAIHGKEFQISCYEIGLHIHVGIEMQYF